MIGEHGSQTKALYAQDITGAEEHSAMALALCNGARPTPLLSRHPRDMVKALQIKIDAGATTPAFRISKQTTNVFEVAMTAISMRTAIDV